VLSNRKLITDGNGNYLIENDLFINAQLGNTLRSIAKNGASAFYEGDIAKNMTNDIQKAGGKRRTSIPLIVNFSNDAVCFNKSYNSRKYF